MEIKEKKGYFLFKLKHSRFAINYKEDVKLKDEVEVNINSSEKVDKVYTISEPGEYEVKDVFTIVMQNGDNMIYLVDFEGVTLLMADPTVKLSEKELNEIGAVDILILSGEHEVNSDVASFVNKIDPQLLILSENIKYESAEKIFGSSVDKVSKKYKAKSSDFDNEEYKLEIIKIEE